jgi:CDP-glucose 4,6-dehydratase
LENMVTSTSFWANKTVFLTGHTGFKGGWLSLWLQALGAKVVGFSLPPPTKPSLFEVAQVARGMISVEGDVRDLNGLTSAMIEHLPEIVIHMAAQPLVRYSYLSPVETYSTNVMGTVNVLEAVRKTRTVKAVINVTSDKCYENKEWVWGYRENEPLGGHDPYSGSKACSELVTDSYRSSYFDSKNYASHGIAVASARAGNVIGGGDWAQDRLIPDMVRAIGRGEKVLIRNPAAIRPWQHVLEPLSGYLILAEKLHSYGPAFAQAWNFGPNDFDVKSVGWLIERVAQAWGQDAAWELDHSQQPHEATYLKLDCSKSRSHLGWQPRWNIEQTIDKIIMWHKSWSQGANMREMTLAQISSYQNAQEILSQ